VAGAELAAAWHLPEGVVEACRWHHEPDGRDFPLLIAAADALAQLDEKRGDPDEARARLCSAGVPPGRVDDLMMRASMEAGGPETP
jgi:HD-like signal output (HDOD) protein